jgi:hypothetical protein
MRCRLVNALLLKSEERDAFAEAVLRRFWALAESPATLPHRRLGRVIDFAPRRARESSIRPTAESGDLEAR